MKVEVVYAFPEQQAMIILDASGKSTVAQVIHLSNVLVHYPEIDLQKNKVGIFGKKVDLQHIVQAGDRIEIYRPLTIDPKEARRIRALKK